MDKTVVHIVDDDPSVRKGLSRLLKSAGFTPQLHPCPEAFLTSLADAPWGCIILDLQMPKLTGLDVQAKLNELKIPLPVIFLTGHGELSTCRTAMKSGACDFMGKPVDESELLPAVEKALTNFWATYERQGKRQTFAKNLSRLTKREHQVMGLVLQGKLNKQIGGELGISEKTVKIHRGRVMGKMQVESLAELVRYSTELKIT